jgi:N-acetylmuramoyl-L-alanine amidase
MAVNVTELNSQISNVNSQLSFSEITSSAESMINQVTAATNTQLGFSVGEVKGGVESLVQNIDYPLGATSTAIPAVSRITANVPGAKSDLVQTISGSDASKLGSIVEAPAESGILDEIITAGTPESIATALNQSLGKTTSEIENCLTSIAPQGLDINVAVSIDQVLDGTFKSPFSSAVTNLSSALTAAVSGFNSTNILKNVVEDFTGQITNTVLSTVNIADAGLAQSVVVDIMNGAVALAVDKSVSSISIPRELSDLSVRVGIEIDKSSVDGLIKSLDLLELAGGSSTSVQAVIGAISGIQSSYGRVAGGISNTVTSGNPAYGTPSPDRIVPIGSTNTGASGPYDTDFSYIESLEEMTADLRAITRSVSTTIVHWTANYIDDNHVDAQLIKQMHIARGWSTIGYHYIIKRDGSIQRGRNPNQTGAHAKSSHNPYSIGISFVAGYNCPNGTANPEGYVSADSINSAQWAAFDTYLKAFYTVYPGGEVWGHQDTDPWNKIDPMTNMTAYVKNKFGKTNVSPQPSRTYSLEELAAKTFEPVRTTPIS